MKKVSLLAILFAATTTSGAFATDGVPAAGCPKAFQGFYVSGNIGYDTGDAKVKAFEKVEGADDVGLLRRDLGSRGVDGGIGAGYNLRLGNSPWVLGLDFTANWANTKGKMVALRSDLDEDNVDGLAVQTKLENSLQLMGRFGYVICEKVMPFVGLGWENAAWKTRVAKFETGEDTVAAHKRKRINAFAWRAGVDFLMTKHVIMGLEYTGSAGGRAKAFFEDEDTEEVVGARVKPQNNKFALTVKVIY